MAPNFNRGNPKFKQVQSGSPRQHRGAVQVHLSMKWLDWFFHGNGHGNANEALVTQIAECAITVEVPAAGD